MSKIRTNLTPTELEKVALGMLRLARSRKLSKAQTIEDYVSNKVHEVLEVYTKSLHSAVDEILLGDD